MSGALSDQPELSPFVSVEVAESELVAVRDLLAELEREVADEERAALEAERQARLVGSSMEAGLSAVERSRRIVEEMAQARQADWRSSYDRARAEAEARLDEASRRAAALGEATTREVTEILATRFPEPAAPTPAPRPIDLALPPVTLPVAAPPAAAPPVYPPVFRPARRTSPLAAPALGGWAVDLDSATPDDPAVVAADDLLRAPMLPGEDVHAAFWREEVQASASRVARSASFAPVEALLPVLALVLLLAAVLLLVG